MNRFLSRQPWDSYTRFFLYSIPFFPLVYASNVVEPFIVPRTIFLLLMTYGALLCFLGSLIFQNRTLYVSRPQIFILVFLVIGCIATVMSQNIELSFFSSYDRMEGLMLWIACVVLSIICGSVLDHFAWKRLLMLLLGVGGVVVLSGMGEYAGHLFGSDGEDRVKSFLGNAIFFGEYTLILFGIAMCAYSYAKSSYARGFAGVLVVFFLYAVFLSGTRSVVLGLGMGIIIGLLLYGLYGENRRRTLKHIGLIVMCVGIFSVSAFTLHSKGIISIGIVDRLLAINLENLETQARYFHYTAALQGIKAQPFLGYGFEGYTRVFERYVDPVYYSDTLSSTPEPWSDRAHNMYLDIAIAVGVPGLIVFLTALVFIAQSILTYTRSTPVFGSIIGALFVAMLVHLLFTFPVLSSLLFISILAGFLASFERQNPDAVVYSIPCTPVSKVAFFTCVGIILVFCIHTVSRYTYAQNVYTCMKTTKEHSTDRMECLYTYGMNDRNDALYAQAEFLTVRATEGDLERKHGSSRADVRRLEDHARSQGALTPRDLYYYGMLYQFLGDFDDAKRVLLEGLNEAPQRMHLLNALSLVYEQSEEYSEALKYAEYAYQLESSYNESILRYAATLYATGHATTAESVLQKEFETSNVNSFELVQGMIHGKYHTRAKTALDRMSFKHKDNPQYAELRTLLKDVQSIR